MSNIHIPSDILFVIKRGDSEKFNIPICLIFYLIENLGLDCYDLIIRFLKPKFLVVLDMELHLNLDNIDIDIVTELELISLCHECISDFGDVISNISETCIFSNLKIISLNFLGLFEWEREQYRSRYPPLCSGYNVFIRMLLESESYMLNKSNSGRLDFFKTDKLTSDEDSGPDFVKRLLDVEVVVHDDDDRWPEDGPSDSDKNPPWCSAPDRCEGSRIMILRYNEKNIKSVKKNSLDINNKSERNSMGDFKCESIIDNNSILIDAIAAKINILEEKKED